MISDIMAIKFLPGMFIGFVFILTIKLRKSPFDLSMSHHGHQELVKGLTTEFSGKTMAVIEIAHWYEIALLLGLVGMFWATNILTAIGLIFITYFAEIVIDNITARLTWRFMVKHVWTVGLTLSIVNLIWLYAR